MEGREVRECGEGPLTHLVIVEEHEQGQEGCWLHIRQSNLVLLCCEGRVEYCIKHSTSHRQTCEQESFVLLIHAQPGTVVNILG